VPDRRRWAFHPNIYPSLYRLEGVSIAANCDLREDVARAVAKRFGIARSYGDIHQMLKQEQPDAAIVCTGAVGHAAIAVDLLNTGCTCIPKSRRPPRWRRFLTRWSNARNSASSKALDSDSIGWACSTGAKRFEAGAPPAVSASPA
jgi:GFO/IDH/MocA oxidoreductase family protein